MSGASSAERLPLGIKLNTPATSHIIGGEEKKRKEKEAPENPGNQTFFDAHERLVLCGFSCPSPPLPSLIHCLISQHDCVVFLWAQNTTFIIAMQRLRWLTCVIAALSGHRSLVHRCIHLIPLVSADRHRSTSNTMSSPAPGDTLIKILLWGTVTMAMLMLSTDRSLPWRNKPLGKIGRSLN